ncbi:MAG: hypothetical protein K2N87_05910 [Eubacterium sp.]|nr:hypothetical protein [Eubacterium sp.]
MKKIISIGMNCEVSFQIQKYVDKFYSSLFSWAFVMDDKRFLRALHNLDDVFSKEIEFHMPTNDMFLDKKYGIAFHGRTPKEKLFFPDGKVKDSKLYDETVEELKTRIAYLKNRFKQDLDSDEEKIYFKKILVEPDLEIWGGKEKLISIIKEFETYFLKNIARGGGRTKKFIVLQKKYFLDG